jgi:hypothetical protein
MNQAWADDAIPNRKSIASKANEKERRSWLSDPRGDDCIWELFLMEVFMVFSDLMFRALDIAINSLQSNNTVS